MAVINVTLPEPVNEWVEAKVRRGDYASVNEYVSDLVRRDQEDADESEAIVEALIKGERSGVSTRHVPDILAALKAERGTAS